MVRLIRGDDRYELWRVETSDGEQLWARTGDGEPQRLATAWKFSVARELSQAMLERLTSGWHRERDPERELAVDEPRDPELDAALRANPGDRAAALVYADWYQQRQHPRGELIAIQVARAERPDDPALRAAEAALLDRERARLIGPLGDRPEDSHRLHLELAWEHGFVRGVRFRGADKDGIAEQLLWEVLRHPSTRFLRELVIGCVQYGDQDNQLIAALLLHAGPTPPLRTLVLADFDDTTLDNIDISRAWLGDLSALSARYPRLEDVVIKGRVVLAHGGLAELALPHCRRFAFRTSGMRAEMLDAIGEAAWPALHELEVWTGTPDYGCTCACADVVRLLDRLPPSVRILRILDCDFTDELVPALIALHTRQPLAELDLSLGTLTDAGAEVLLARAGELAGLGGLRIYDNCVSGAMLARLRASALPIAEGSPFPGEGWDRSDYDRADGQKLERYVSVSE